MGRDDDRRVMPAFLPLVAVSLLGLFLAGVGSHIGSVLVTSFGLLSVGLVVAAVAVTRVADGGEGRRAGANGTGK
jgi:hypothetical protein